MAFDPLTVAETNADSPITEPLMAKIKGNFDDLDIRINNTPPTGSVAMWPYSAAPAHWLFCDGLDANCTTYEALFDIALPDIAAWGRGASLGDFTVDTVTDEIILAAHGRAVDDVWYASTTGTLPAGLTADTKYYVVALNGADRIQISATKGGVAINITDVGTGTHSGHSTFKLPDARGRSPLGVNDAVLPNGADAGLTTRNEGARGGEEAHVLTVAELASHTHRVKLGTSTEGGGASAQGNSDSTPAWRNWTESIGGNAAHNTMHPFFTINFIIYAGI